MKANLVKRFFLYVAVIFVLIYVLFPVGWAVLSSLVSEIQLVNLSSTLSLEGVSLTLQNYVAILFPWAAEAAGSEYVGIPFGSYFYVKSLSDTVIISLSTMALTLVVGSLAGYSLARLVFPGKKYMFLLLIIIQMIPGLATAIPVYLIWRSAGLLDTYIAYVVTLSAWFAPFVAWLMASFYQTIPVEIGESALVDGCGRFGAFLRIELPLSAPGVITSAIWTFLSSWGEFMFGLILTGTNVLPLTVLISWGVGEWRSAYGFMCAQSFFALLVPVITALLFQRYLVKGLVAGAVKG